MASLHPKNMSHGTFSVAAALVGNAVITVAKFIGFYISGSSALFSEAVHSFADTMNQSLLLIGIKKSGKRADDKYAYGYGQERFLWALISACGIFFLGAGVTAYNGIEVLLHPRPLELNPLIYFILTVSFIIETSTFYIALKELRHSGGEKKIRELLKTGDPTVIAVLYEDFVALIGVLVAFTSITLSLVTQKYYWDAIGSVIIGVMLAVVAILLINKNRSYLIKKSIPEEVKDRIIELLEADSTIERVLDFKSSVLDINHYRIKCEVEFNGSALLAEESLSDNLRTDFDRSNGDFEEFKKLFVGYLDRVPRLIGKRIDQIEKMIKNEFPEVVHIDIEIN